MPTAIRYIHSVVPLATPDDWAVYTASNRNGKPSIVAYTNSKTKSDKPIAKYKTNDSVLITWDAVQPDIIIEIRMVAQATQSVTTVTTKQPLFTTPGGQAVTRTYYANVELIDILTAPTNPTPVGVMYVLKVKLAGGNSIHIMNIHGNTIVPKGGLRSFNKGDIIKITYDSEAWVHKIELVKSKAESEHDKEISFEFNLAEVAKEVCADPSDWTNFARLSIMHTCSAAAPKIRKTCHFWEKQRFGTDCSHYRETMGNLCDCVKAHIHRAKYGPAPDRATKSDEPEKGWDELMKERGLT